MFKIYFHEIDPGITDDPVFIANVSCLITKM